MDVSAAVVPVYPVWVEGSVDECEIEEPPPPVEVIRNDQLCSPIFYLAALRLHKERSCLTTLFDQAEEARERSFSFWVEGQIELPDLGLEEEGHSEGGVTGLAQAQLDASVPATPKSELDALMASIDLQSMSLEEQRAALSMIDDFLPVIDNAIGAKAKSQDEEALPDTDVNAELQETEQMLAELHTRQHPLVTTSSVDNVTDDVVTRVCLPACNSSEPSAEVKVLDVEADAVAVKETAAELKAAQMATENELKSELEALMASIDLQSMTPAEQATAMKQIDSVLAKVKEAQENANAAT